MAYSDPEQFYNNPADVDWLFSVHLNNFPVEEQDDVNSFFLVGNEDCPTEIRVFSSADPRYNEAPKKVYRIDIINGEYYVVEDEE